MLLTMLRRIQSFENGVLIPPSRPAKETMDKYTLGTAMNYEKFTQEMFNEFEYEFIKIGEIHKKIIEISKLNNDSVPVEIYKGMPYFSFSDNMIEEFKKIGIEFDRIKRSDFEEEMKNKSKYSVLHTTTPKNSMMILMFFDELLNVYEYRNEYYVRFEHIDRESFTFFDLIAKLTNSNGFKCAKMYMQNPPAFTVIVYDTIGVELKSIKVSEIYSYEEFINEDFFMIKKENGEVLIMSTDEKTFFGIIELYPKPKGTITPSYNMLLKDVDIQGMAEDICKKTFKEPQEITFFTDAFIDENDVLYVRPHTGENFKEDLKEFRNTFYDKFLKDKDPEKYTFHMFGVNM